MQTTLFKVGTFLAMSVVVLVGVSMSSPEVVTPSNVVGGFCSAADCDSTFTADCLGKNCPKGTKHDECSLSGEKTGTCSTSGNCKNTAGCDAHDDCSC